MLESFVIHMYVGRFLSW